MSYYLNKRPIYSGTNPIASSQGDQEADIWVVTSDGTATGIVQRIYQYRGSSVVWVKTYDAADSEPALGLAPKPKIRTYHDPGGIFFDGWIGFAPTVAQVQAEGFTAVGAGMSITVWGNFQNRGITRLENNTTKTLANLFTIPTAYTRHEVAIIPGKLNYYHIATLNDRATVIEFWVCDPITGVPVERLLADVNSATGVRPLVSVALSPLNETRQMADRFEWLQTPIPANIVDQYKTATNTLKIAFLSSYGSTQPQLLHTSGYATTIETTDCPGYHVTQGLIGNATCNGGSQLVFDGTITPGRACWAIPAGATIPTVRVALPRLDKSIYLNVLAATGFNGTEGNKCQQLEFELVHPSGNVFLGRPQLTKQAPIALPDSRGLELPHCPGGWIIDAATLASKSIKPTNSALSYLELKITNLDKAAIAYGSGFVVECKPL